MLIWGKGEAGQEIERVLSGINATIKCNSFPHLLITPNPECRCDLVIFALPTQRLPIGRFFVVMSYKK